MAEKEHQILTRSLERRVGKGKGPAGLSSFSSVGMEASQRRRGFEEESSELQNEERKGVVLEPEASATSGSSSEMQDVGCAPPSPETPREGITFREAPV